MTAFVWAPFVVLSIFHLALLPSRFDAATSATKILLVPLLLGTLFFSARGSGVSNLVVVGLVFGWLGDALLLRRSQRCFLAGLTAFLAGHVAYIAWFIRHVETIRIFPAVIAAALLVGAAFVVWPRAGAVRVPAIAYSGVLCTLVVCAVWGWQSGWERGPYAVLGAALFLLSDAILGMREFTNWIGRARIAVMATYLPAQLLIAITAIGTS